MKYALNWNVECSSEINLKPQDIEANAGRLPPCGVHTSVRVCVCLRCGVLTWPRLFTFTPALERYGRHCRRLRRQHRCTNDAASWVWHLAACRDHQPSDSVCRFRRRRRRRCLSVIGLSQKVPLPQLMKICRWHRTSRIADAYRQKSD